MEVVTLEIGLIKIFENELSVCDYKTYVLPSPALLKHLLGLQSCIPPMAAMKMFYILIFAALKFVLLFLFTVASMFII